ncbi:hypothetical protein ACFFMP_03605 [Pseudoroseomonas cervicalis]|uniref:Uncharacterized protein n=1 Tax=Pseudoroseomonas cervicalis ATCC 49957 TaxID=525371 RepID=D5RPI4_9PROT|nr:hypothetical protein [Pseudoroseomonas cervicalis]EFH10779.1 hypothetical protein HMPREF0731_2995 [Pseudoroseomonas cervicalis ATCC 49957]
MRLRWQRGRIEDPGPGAADPHRALEWVGCDDAGDPIARVVRVRGPVWFRWHLRHAVALDEEARVVELRPSVAENRWLVVVRDQVVGRAPLPLQAVRRAEAALAL